MAPKNSFIAGLDLGSTKTCAIICEVLQNGKVRVAGFGTAESKGWRRGIIVNLDSALLSIRKAVEIAEDGAGTSVDSAFIGVGGPHIKGVNSRGGIMLGRSGQIPREVTGEDVRKVFLAAQAVSLPADRQVIYAERQEYLLDAQDGIRNPVGMSGTRLEVDVHLVTASVTAHENIIAAVNKAGIVVSETVYEALAAAESCLTPDERELGVALLEIGGSNSHLIIYHQGSVRYSGVVPIGGDHFTNDIAVGLRTPIPEAEKLKVRWGQRESSEDAVLEVASVGERPSRTISYSVLGDIIEPRTQELLELVLEEIERSGLSTLLGGGVVLTGGGGKLGGLAEMAERTFELPARVGQPYGLESMGDTLPDAAYSTLVGLVLHGLRLRPVIESRATGLSGKLWNIFRGN